LSEKYSHHKTLKKAIAVIASEFFTFFADQTQEKVGIRPNPTSITIQSVDIKRNVGRKRELYLVELNLSTDVGMHETRLFIKLFKDHSKVLQEASGAIYLEDHLKGKKGEEIRVMTPKLLYYSKEWNILVYEGIYGDDFDNFNLCSIEDKMMLIGSALPKIQGFTMKEIDLQRYYLLLEKTINELYDICEYSLPNYEKIIPQIRELLIQELEQRMFYSYSGALSFGDFHTGNIMLQANPMKLTNLFTKDVNKNAETLNRTMVWILDPEFFDLESINYDRIDRMEDIANVFTSYLLSEFSEKNSIKKTVKLIEKFLIGYNLEFKKKTGINLQDCYPKGSTLEYQIAQSLLFDIIHYLRNQFDSELMRTGLDLRLNLIKNILEKRIINP
jgi:hypothetical protein